MEGGRTAVGVGWGTEEVKLFVEGSSESRIGVRNEAFWSGEALHCVRLQGPMERTNEGCFMSFPVLQLLAK